MLRHTSDIAEQRWLTVINESGEEVPAFGCLKVLGLDAGNADVIRVTKPDADGQDVLVNGAMPIPVGKTGAATRDFPSWAAFDTAGGVPVVGDTAGAKSGSFKARKGLAGFIVKHYDATNLRVLVTNAGGGGGGSPLTVEEVDGTPSVGGVTKIRVDQADGLSIVDETGGVVRLKFAGALTVKEEDGTPTVANVKTIILAAPNLKLTDNGGGVVTIDTVGYTGLFLVEVVCNGDGTITKTYRNMNKGVGK